MKLTGKKALITGGNSGIGLATAELFIQEGAEVAITGRDQTTLDAAVQRLGAKAIAFRTDMTDTAARRQLFAELSRRFGQLDIVFANAGIAQREPTGSEQVALFESIISVNLTSAYFTAEDALPFLKDGGAIIFNSSVLGSLGPAGRAAYAASKAGLRGLARSLATDLAPRGIRVNVVAPGATRTPIWDRQTGKPSEAAEQKNASMIPLGRMGEASEVAKAVLFLASDDSSYVNSVELFVDGGMVGSPLGAPIYR